MSAAPGSGHRQYRPTHDPVTTDPQTLALLDRLAALAAETSVTIMRARLAIAATDQVLRSARHSLAFPPVRADQVGRDPSARQGDRAKPARRPVRR